MATQLHFTRRTYDSVEGSFDGSDASSALHWGAAPRHVAFAVHDAVPSPQLYLNRQKQREEYDPDEDNDRPYESRDDRVADEVETGSAVAPLAAAPRRVEPTRMAKTTSGRTTKKLNAKTATKPQKTAAVPVKPIRRPGWEADARPTSTLFDASLKKNTIFQPRAGGRICDAEEEARAVRADRPRATIDRKRSSTSNIWNERIAKSLPSQSRRQQKDFVKMNMEKITGQRYETLVRRKMQSKIPATRRGSVFERLAAPVIHKSLLRFRSPSPTRMATSTKPSQPHAAEEFTPTQLTIATPVIHTPVQEADRSQPRRQTPVPKRSSPGRGRVSTLRSATPTRGSPSGFRLDTSPRDQNPTMAERVFEILDRQGRGRIGVEQIVDGLRLLQLPATHNQVSDYVYLIHEGSRNTISLEEWSILVGTLDAASETTIYNAPSHPTSQHTPSSVIPERSPPRSRASTRSSPPRFYNQIHSPPTSIEKSVEYNQRSPFFIRMPESNLSKIATHSEDLANLLLDDLLLETAEDLNKQERHQAHRAYQQLEVDALDNILMQIERIEQAETELIENGMALGYEINRPCKALVDTTEEVVARKATRTQSGHDEEDSNLVLPLGVVMSIGDKEDINNPPVTSAPDKWDFQSEQEQLQLPPTPTRGDEEIESSETYQQTASVSMSCLSGRLFQSIEKNRVRFMKHRRLVESSLESTGMDQASVIEMLTDLLLDEITMECAAELEDGVETLTETLALTLL